MKLNKTIDEKIKEVLKDAKRSLSDGRDNKVYLHISKFKLILQKALQDTEGNILRLNNEQMGGKYDHQLFYKGIRFVSVSDEMIELNEEKTAIKEKEIILKDYLDYEPIDIYFNFNIWVIKQEAKT